MKEIPEGYHTVTPSLTMDGAAEAIQLYKKAFSAKEVYRMEHPGKPGRVMHACLQIGSSRIFLADTDHHVGTATPSVSSFYLYLENVDAAFKQAKQAGLTEAWAPTDMFWGDRTGVVRDKFGISWTLATHMREVSPEEMEKGAKTFVMKAA